MRHAATRAPHILFVFLVPAGLISAGAASPAVADEEATARRAAHARRLAREAGYPSGHLETPRDLPARRSSDQPAQRSAGWSSWTLGPYVSIQVNVDEFGNNIPGDAANEPSIAIDPTDPDRMAIGWRQFDAVESDFRQAGWGYSQDGGLTWIFPGTLERGVFRSDPVLDSNADGVFYYYSLNSAFTCQLFRSFDGGVSWGSGISAFGGDKAWMTVDRTSGIGRGTIYCAWSVVAGCCDDRVFTRSTNGGSTFMQPITVPGLPFWGTMAVAPNGALFIAGGAVFGSAPVARSRSAQNPAVTPSFDHFALVDLGGWSLSGTGPNPGGLLGQVYVAADHSSGLTAGNVYLLGSVDPPGPDPLEVMFIRSTDEGVTWSAPVRVNDDSQESGAWQWFGTMSVAPNGRIDAVWNDTRADPTVTFSELYYAFSTDGGGTWAPNVPISVPFNHFLGYPSQEKLGDYYHMVSDNLGASLAYAATFNGEQDVYFLRIRDLDCNDNDIEDVDDISGGTSADCNSNSIPDECEPDCNTNGEADECEIDALIDAQPADRQDCPGETALFSVRAPDAGAFQWYKDGTALFDGGRVTGATTDTLTISGVIASDAGSYRCEAIDGCLVAESDPAILVVVEAASITDQPEPLVTRCIGQTAVFAVVAGGTALTYSWSKDGVPLIDDGRISGALGPTLRISGITVADDGTYVCYVADPCGGEDVSESGVLEIPNPVFVLDPQDTCAQPGGTATFTAEAESLPFQQVGYRWKKNGTFLSDGGDVSGARTATLTIRNVSADDAGLYGVTAFSTDPVCFTDSVGATLTVGGCCESTAVCPHADVNCDGVADSFDVAVIRSAENWFQTPAEAGEPRADVNDDGIIDGFDIAAIRMGTCWLQ